MAAACLAASVQAQMTLDFPRGEFAPVNVDTGRLDNASDEYVVVYDDVVWKENAAWLRLYFSSVVTPQGSFIRVTSVFDNETQELDAQALAEWSDTTAYFNGDTLIVELWAAPHTVGNRFVIEKIAFENGLIHPPSAAGECGICNGDNRTPSFEEWACRLMPVGCSASVYNTESCMVSAGHCMSGNLVAQFRVPPSSGCRPQNPGVSDQFPIISRQSTNGGVGNDWAVMTTGTNNVGQKAFQRYGVMRPIAEVLPSSGATDVWGYGVSSICERTQAQQDSPGNIISRQATFYTYTNDVTGGNSGSGYIFQNQIIGVVTHCNQGGCGNIATRIDHSAFKAAIAALCPAGGVGCDDIQKHKSKCKSNGGIKGKVVLFTNEFNGEKIQVNIDGDREIELTISGKKAVYKNFFESPGEHTVMMTRPRCVQFDKRVNCP
ncbi:MAG: hypothetical protein C4547_11915 [Phycisphaerales bacterium]|nr:MAG: hypothetical protein C4547_11915 [Phycisphaerales bacterium]